MLSMSCFYLYIIYIIIYNKLDSVGIEPETNLL